MAARGDVYRVRLDPTRGSEIRKTQPCLVVSPDELNEHLRTVIVAPMTTGGQAYPWRIQCRSRVGLDLLRRTNFAQSILNDSRGDLGAWLPTL